MHLLTVEDYRTLVRPSTRGPDEVGRPDSLRNAAAHGELGRGAVVETRVPVELR